MTELKLSEIKDLLPDKKSIHKSSAVYMPFEDQGYNKAIDDLSTKNLLDYVEAVVCPECNGAGWYAQQVSHDEQEQRQCESCNGTGAVIRVKEGE